VRSTLPIGQNRAPATKHISHRLPNLLESHVTSRIHPKHSNDSSSQLRRAFGIIIYVNQLTETHQILYLTAESSPPQVVRSRFCHSRTLLPLSESARQCLRNSVTGQKLWLWLVSVMWNIVWDVVIIIIMAVWCRIWYATWEWDSWSPGWQSGSATHMWDHVTLVICLLGGHFVEPCPLMRRLTDKSSQPVVVFV